MSQSRVSLLPLLVVVLVVVCAPLLAYEPGSSSAVDTQMSFHRDVEPILQRSCQPCHRQDGDNYTGMVAPMSLTTYAEVRPWARSIAKQVMARDMPPWMASAEYHGVFKNERTLSEAEIETIVKWAKAGAPAGDPGEAPEPLVFEDTGGWRIGKPDLVVTTEPYFVPDDADTHYINHKVVLTEEMLPESRWIKAIEWKGGSDVVHHIVGYGFQPGAEDDRTRAYGLGSIAPGEEPMQFPPGYAKLLIEGSTIVFSMHYHKEKGPGTGKWDASQVAFEFYDDDAEIEHFVEHNAIGFRWFDIPPGHPNWRVGAARVFEDDTTLIALHPHMHVRGRSAKYVAYYPDGSAEEILSVPEWDFNWQTDYSYAQPKKLPAGTRLEYVAYYDNSDENPANPDPTVPIDWGPETWDEMMLGYVTFSKTEPEPLTVDKVLAEHFGGPVSEEPDPDSADSDSED